MADRPLHILTATSIYPTPENPMLGAFVASQVDSLRSVGLNVDVLFLDVQRSKRELLRGALAIRRRLRNEPYDVVHAHFGYTGLPALAQTQCPVVISFCGTDLVHPRIAPLSRFVARRADACIVKSDRLAGLLDGTESSVIPNGVDLDLFQGSDRSVARRQLDLNDDVAYALFASDPTRPEKRYELALEAVKAASTPERPIELLVLKGQPQDRVPDYLNAADVLLLTSTHEGSPNAVKEAMACNLPVVSTDVGDVRDVVSGTRNCAVAEATPESLGQSLRSVLADGRRSDGRDHIAHLSADAIAARVISVYRNVIDRRESSRRTTP